jgi:hypothetical protein
MQKSIAPRGDFFTSVPPKKLQLQKGKWGFVWELPVMCEPV